MKVLLFTGIKGRFGFTSSSLVEGLEEGMEFICVDREYLPFINTNGYRSAGSDARFEPTKEQKEFIKSYIDENPIPKTGYGWPSYIFLTGKVNKAPIEEATVVLRDGTVCLLKGSTLFNLTKNQGKVYEGTPKEAAQHMLRIHNWQPNNKVRLHNENVVANGATAWGAL